MFCERRILLKFALSIQSSHLSLLVFQVAEGTRNMPHLWDLCSNEIVVRSAKHIIKVTNKISSTSALFKMMITL